jgi:hypothetical protein
MALMVWKELSEPRYDLFDYELVEKWLSCSHKAKNKTLDQLHCYSNFQNLE